MQIYRTIGKVTLARCHDSFRGARLIAVESIGDQLLGRSPAETDTLIVWDDLGANDGSLVAVSDGAEAAQPFRPELKPVDAYCAAILDHIEVYPQEH